MADSNNMYDLQEQICYMQCGHCFTILLVNVPINSLSCTLVTVRCGHCTSILPVNMSTVCFVPLHFISSLSQNQETTVQQPKQENCSEEVVANEKLAKDCCPSFCFSSDDDDYEDSVSINQVNHKPPEKKQRTPSAYNNFIKEEIKRLKIEYPNMSHKQAFSTAAKNWAHCPQSWSKGEEHVQDLGDHGAQRNAYVRC